MSLKPEVAALAEKIKTGLELNNQTGLGAPKADVNLYEQNLPEHLSMDQVVAVGDYNTTFNAAGTDAAGQLAVEAMRDNKSLERVTFEIPMAAKDLLSVNVDRHKTFTNHLTGGGETHKYGVVSTAYEVQAGKNAGQLKKARTLIGEFGAEALK